MQGEDLRYSYMFWLPFTAVFREGIETVIFLAGTSSNYEVKWGEKLRATHGQVSTNGGVTAFAWCRVLEF